MRYLLSRSQAAVLARHAHAHVLLAFDFDGTLAPITRARGAAKMRARTQARFASAATRYPCVVISGRSRADLARRMRGVSVAALIGNHGIEPSSGMQRWIERVRRWHDVLLGALGNEPGVELEDKRYSLAVHYRKARDKERALRAIRKAVRKLGAGVRQVAGKQVLNLVPIGAPHKGHALVALCERFGVREAIYVGDDVTDEDVFLLTTPKRLLTVRVGKHLDSSAGYYLRSQSEIDELLERLCRLRE
jgi:trehalose 6-phosphate phosphatase